MTALTNEQLTARLAKAETAIARLEQIAVRRSLTSAEMDYFATKFPDLVVKAVAQAAAPAAQAATVSRLAPTEGAVSGLYFNKATGDAVLLTKDGTAFSFDANLNRTAIKGFTGQGFDYICKNGLPPVIDKQVATLRADNKPTATVSAKATGKPTAPARVAEVAAAAKPAAKPALVKIGNVETMTDAAILETIAAMGVDPAAVVADFNKADYKQARRFWLHSAKEAAKAGATMKKAVAAAFVALAE